MDLPDYDWRSREEQDRTDSAKKSLNTMLQHPPSNPVELSITLKRVIDGDYLPQPVLQDEGALRALFGATSVRREEGNGDINLRMRFSNASLRGLSASLRRVSMHVNARDDGPFPRVDEHIADLFFAEFEWSFPSNAPTVDDVVRIFGPPILTTKGCLRGSHALLNSEPQCKGSFIYDYSEKVFSDAKLLINQITFVVMETGLQRRSGAWNQRRVEDRQRFLCDEDQIKRIEISQWER